MELGNLNLGLKLFERAGPRLSPRALPEDKLPNGPMNGIWIRVEVELDFKLFFIGQKNVIIK